MLRRNGGDSFLLPMTLAEVSILLFFLLLFVAISQIREVESEVRKSSAKIEKLEEYISKAESLSKSQMKKVMEGAKKEKKIEKLKEKVSNLEDQMRGLDSLASMREQYDDDEFRELVRKASRNIGRREKIDKLTERLEETQSVLDSTESTLSDYKAQITNVTQRLKEAGQGYPPCWADEDGSPQYIYTVRLLGDSLGVRPKWPPDRKEEVEAVNGARELANRRVSRSTFAKLARPILEWSKRQDPECRHFVIIKDTKNTTKNEFKDELLLVEGFFYKYIDR